MSGSALRNGATLNTVATCTHCEERSMLQDWDHFSPGGSHRYFLHRTLKPRGNRRKRRKRIAFMMLNSSWATARKPDNSVRRCYGFAEREDAESVTIVNMFALVSPYPRDLIMSDSPLEHARGMNDLHVRMALQSADRIIVAWGANPGHRELRWRLAEVAKLLDGRRLESFGTTKDGHPPHPLYLAGETAIVRYAIPDFYRHSQPLTSKQGTS
jgi:hypothetical protein